MAFMPWKEWNLSVPVAKDMRFLYAADAESRFFHFGAMNCIASTTNVTPAPVIYGVLYVRMVIDLFDPVPIVSSVNALLSSASLFRTRRIASSTPPPSITIASTKPATASPPSESKEPLPLDVDDDPTSADSPYFRVGMTPSAAPGGTLYLPSHSSSSLVSKPVKIPSKK
jgi:hypothetical protein